MPFVIDVDPVAFTLLGVPVRWYGLILVVAAAAAVWVTVREARRRGMGDEVVWDAVVWVGLAALVGGRVLYVAQNELGSLAAHPAHLLMVWMGGLSFYGGLVGALIALALLARRRALSFLVALDVAAPGAAIGQAIGHLGCLIGGDSFGLPTRLPWAVVYRNPNAMAPLDQPLHPTQAYEAILLGALFVVLWRNRGHLERLGNGVMASAYLFGLASIRFGLFFLRDEPSVLLGLKTAQWIGLGVGIVAVAIYIVSRQTERATGVTPAHLEVRPS